MSTKYFKFFEWFLVICLYILLTLLLSSGIDALNIKNDILLNCLFIASEVLIAAIFVFIYRKDFKGKYQELKSDEGNKKIFSSFKIWLIGLALMIIFNIFLSIIIGDIAQNEEINRNVISNYSFYAITSMILLTPICEEIIFRLSISKMNVNKYIYIAFSGIIFGFAHVISATGLQTLYVIPYAALGCSFAYIYEKQKNILCTILMHSVHNLICILIILFI